MEQRGFYEPAERDRTGSGLRPDVTGRTASRLTSWSRVAAALAASGDLVPTQRECTAAS
ncbi:MULTISPECIES: hypothetical protein [Cellulomonas]|jgi:hypothetical protein|uniref:hypothetical protein n=1 Tax=Cellulomonas TaxID=1707 RepID=UPI001B93E486|nr:MULTISPECIES: hypothetical protein [Cellulomonas]VTR75742.1 hypothetical protein CHMI_00494 [Cellulomonas hominis]